nr:hypothetical protein [Tanacetum cinerariifolium]
MWSAQEKRVQKIDRLARSLLIQGLPNDIYSLIDSNKTIKNGDQPLPRVTQVSIAGTTSTEQPPLKDKSMWSDQEKRNQGDVNDAIGSRKKTVVVTFDLLALIAEKTNVSR